MYTRSLGIVPHVNKNATNIVVLHHSDDIISTLHCSDKWFFLQVKNVSVSVAYLLIWKLTINLFNIIIIILN